MPCYINGVGAILAQKPLLAEALLVEPIDHAGEKLMCVEPDYSRYFDVRQLRRMSRIIRMGMAAGMDALREADVKVPDGIITGTGFGCLDDTGIFLTKMIENKEQALNPTPFIQSTHNTIGSQLALLLHCQGYNQTYTQRALSFENGLLDACMAIADEPTQGLLTGAADEITTVSHDVLRRFHGYRRENTSSLRLFDTNAKGTLNGEGAAYFLLSGDRQHGAVILRGVQTFYKTSKEMLSAGINSFLNSQGLKTEDIDVMLSGACGDAALDSGLEVFLQGQFPQSTYAVFKHLTGEFPTASALAMAIGCRTIQAGKVPEIIVRTDASRAPKNILIFNGYYDLCHSMILLSAS